MNETVIKNIERGRVDEALSFVWDVFPDYESPDYTREGADEFF